MASENQNFSMYSGDTHYLDVMITGADGNAVDLTGADISWVLFNQDRKLLLIKGIGSGITLTDPVNGLFRVTIFPSDTSFLSGTYGHEIEIEDAQEQNVTVLRGTVEIKPDVF